jgi:hypothetical protein
VGESASPHERGDRLGSGAPRRITLAGDEVADDRVDRVGISGAGGSPGRLELVDELGRGSPQICFFKLPAEVCRGAPTLVVRARDPVPVSPVPALGDDEEGAQGVVDREDVEPGEFDREGSGRDSNSSTTRELET